MDKINYEKKENENRLKKKSEHVEKIEDKCESYLPQRLDNIFQLSCYLPLLNSELCYIQISKNVIGSSLQCHIIRQIWTQK